MLKSTELFLFHATDWKVLSSHKDFMTQELLWKIGGVFLIHAGHRTKDMQKVVLKPHKISSSLLNTFL